MLDPLLGAGGGGIDGHSWLLDPAVSHAWIADPGYVQAPDGVSATAWLPAKGDIPLIQDISESRPTFCADWGNNQGCFRMNGVNQYFEAHALAAFKTGTSVPCSFVCVAQVLRIQAGHYVSFGRSIATPSPNGPYYIFYNDAMSTNGRTPITRNTDGNSAVQGTPTQTVALARTVLTCVFNGTTAFIRINGQVTSVTAQNLAGATTLDQFRIGASATPGVVGSFLACNYRALVMGFSTWGPATYGAIERAFLAEF